MKLVFDIRGANKDDALGIAKHNARIKGHWEGNTNKNETKGGIKPELFSKNIELKPMQSFKDENLIKGRKIIGGRQKLAVEFTTWMIQAGGMDEKQNILFLKEANNWLSQEFGEDNILSSHIHLDEETPQLQVVMSNIKKVNENEIYFSQKKNF